MILRGENAQRFVSDPAYKQAIEGMKREIVEQWSLTPARDTEGREWVWRHYKIIERLDGLVKGYIEAGRLERLVEEQKENKVVDWFKRKTN